MSPQLETSELRRNWFLVSFDINIDDYHWQWRRVVSELEVLSAKPIQKSVWAVAWHKSAAELMNHLQDTMRERDRLLVVGMGDYQPYNSITDLRHFG